MRFPKLRATLMVLLATSALAACAGGMSGIPRVASPTSRAHSMTASGIPLAVSPAAEARSVTPMSNPCSKSTNISTDSSYPGSCMGPCPPGAPSGTCGLTPPSGGPPSPPPGWNNCVIGCNPGNPGDPINVGPPCTPISSCIVWPGKTAKFGDQCTAGTLSIGQEVPGYGDTSHLASGTWSVDASSGSALDVIGYIYPTLGGTAYFVPLSSSIGVAVFGISFNSSVPVGSNTSIANVSNIDNFLSKHLLHGFKLGNPVNCYPGGNWNGKYPS